MNPRVVVEVLSDATEAYDRGEKLDHYRRIPSLAAVVFVSHRSRKIEIQEHDTKEKWMLISNGDIDHIFSKGVYGIQMDFSLPESLLPYIEI